MFENQRGANDFIVQAMMRSLSSRYMEEDIAKLTEGDKQRLASRYASNGRILPGRYYLEREFNLRRKEKKLIPDAPPSPFMDPASAAMMSNAARNERMRKGRASTIVAGGQPVPMDKSKVLRRVLLGGGV